MDLLYTAGISPLQLVQLDSVSNVGTKIVFEDEEISDTKMEIEISPRFNIFKVYSWKQAKPWFWVVVTYCFFSFLFSLVMLSFLIWDISGTENTVLILSCNWSSYLVACCFIYIVHFIKHKDVCDLLFEWQKIEGEINTGKEQQ